MARALITGVSGQDGAYLARLLLAQGYEVHGTTRSALPVRLPNLDRLGVRERVSVHQLDPLSAPAVAVLLDAVRPDEVYHLACASSVGESFGRPAEAVFGAVTGTVNLLETIRRAHPSTRFYHSASGDMFGGDRAEPYTECDAFRPRSPYAVGKAAAHWAVVSYRESYDLFACSGILFNHESPLRGEQYVTRKITSTVARLRAGTASELRLGDLSIRRDWGYAEEYVAAMWRMLRHREPADFVIATGRAHSLQEFVEVAFAEAGLDWRAHTVTDPALLRPNEVRCSVGDPARAARELGWSAQVGFGELVRTMVEHDCGLLEPAPSPAAVRV
jgi:GDPmannose 4,6-dehydratase